MSKPKFFLVVAGGRDFNDFDRMKREICDLMWNELKDRQVVIIQGECPTGADYWAKHAAHALNLTCVPCPADWAAHGRAAGPIRNSYMAEHGSGLLAFWDGQSKGTADMITKMKAKGKSTRVRVY
jgi:uncharacterized phage-like protein YoqJ